AVAPQGDPAADRQNQGAGAGAGAVVDVLRRRQGQGRDRAGPRQAVLRQAGRPGQTGREPRDGAGHGAASQGAGVSRDPLTAPPTDDADVAAWTAALGLDGLIDLHVHFLPEQVMTKVWAFFDRITEQYGMPWPVHYRLPQDDRLAVLRALAVQTFAPLVY